MVFFPENVFKKIISYALSPHPAFRAWSELSGNDEMSKAMLKGLQERLTTKPYSKKLLPLIFHGKRVRGYGYNHLTDRYVFDLDSDIVQKSGMAWKCCRTNAELRAYLKQNKIKGYSGKKKADLIKMCMSF